MQNISLILVTLLTKALLSTVALANTSPNCGTIPRWSCGATQTDLHWKSYDLTGEGMTAADAWQDLLTTAKKTDCRGCHLVMFLNPDSPSKSPRANLVQSCIRN